MSIKKYDIEITGQRISLILLSSWNSSYGMKEKPLYGKMKQSPEGEIKFMGKEKCLDM